MLGRTLSVPWFTRETVDGETPARLATSLIVGTATISFVAYVKVLPFIDPQTFDVVSISEIVAIIPDF